MAHNLTAKTLVSRALPSSTTRHIPPSRLFSSSASSPPRIAIVGGGPAGLTLGALLHQRLIPFTIFEYRPQPTPAEWARPSGMLDMHEGDGLAAIRACGLYDDFLPLTGECSEAFVLADKNGVVVPVRSTVAEKQDKEAARPEISRNNLAQLLLSRIPPQSVRWGHKLQNAEYNAGVTTLDFGGGDKNTDEFDLVVGADGAWSRVRTLLTSVRPQYRNTQVVTATIRHLGDKYPHLAQLLGTGSFSALGDGHGVISQRGPLDSARLYLWLTCPDEKLGVTSGMASCPPTAATALLLEDDKFLGKFGPVVKELVTTALREEEQDNPGVGLDIRGLYALPYGTSWTSKKGVTVIGDAAHVMLPNGEGVNQAMLDAKLLAEAVAAAYDEVGGQGREEFGKVLEGRVEMLEREMVERAVKVGEETEQLLGMMLGPDAANTMARMFQQHDPEERWAGQA